MIADGASWRGGVGFEVRWPEAEAGAAWLE